MDRVCERQQQYQSQDERVIASHDHHRCISLLRQYHLLRQPSDFRCSTGGCSRLGQPMSESPDKSRIDGCVFWCPQCSQKHCIRTGSIFYGTRNLLISIYRCFFLGFLENASIVSALEIALLPEKTVKRIYRFCKYQVSIHYERLFENVPLAAWQPGQNSPSVVEVDESLFTHLRDPSYRTRSESQCWVLGVIQRSTGEFRCVAIGNDRTSANIAPIFQELVATSQEQGRRTIVYTDGAAFYSFLDAAGYERRIVNHSQGFGVGDDTTNHIESLWSQLKRIGKFDSGWNFSSVDQVQHALNETCWRLQNRNSDTFALLASILSENYSSNNDELIVNY